MQDALRFWIDRGAAGYRVDAIDRLAEGRAAARRPARDRAVRTAAARRRGAALAHTNSRNAPDTGEALARIREAVGDALLVGEIYLPSAKWQPYLEHLDARLRVRAAPRELGRRAPACRDRGDHSPPRRRLGALEPRLRQARDPLRSGERALRRAAPAHAAGAGLPLPGRRDRARRRPGRRAGYDRAGRDRFRHPMQWDASASGGFSTGEAWLPPVDPERTNVEDQREDPHSTLSLVRDLLTVRRVMGDGFELLDAEPGRARLPPRRPSGRHQHDFGRGARPLGGELVLETFPGAWSNGRLAAHSGVITRSEKG